MKSNGPEQRCTKPVRRRPSSTTRCETLAQGWHPVAGCARNRADPYREPTAFEHHALAIVAQRMVHCCGKTCTKGKQGKSGCRLAYRKGHGIERTGVVELIPGAECDSRALRAGASDDVRCPACWNRGARRNLLIDDDDAVLIVAGTAVRMPARPSKRLFSSNPVPAGRFPV